MNENDFERLRQIIRDEIATANAALVLKLTQINFNLQRRLANEIGECQLPLIEGVGIQHDDLNHVVTAVKDLQSAFDVLVKKLEAVFEPSPDELGEPWRDSLRPDDDES